MTSKRAEPSEPSSSSPPPPTHHPNKRQKHALTNFDGSKLANIRLHVVQAKMSDETISELFALAEKHGCMLCDVIEDANVVITEVRMRRRLECHLDWALAHEKAIVTPQWLRDSVAHGHSLPCIDYAALSELRKSTDDNCPSCGCSGHETEDDDDDPAGNAYPSPRKRQRKNPCQRCSCACGGHSACEIPHEYASGKSAAVKSEAQVTSSSASAKVLLTPPSSPELASAVNEEALSAGINTVNHVVFNRTKAPHTICKKSSLGKLSKPEPVSISAGSSSTSYAPGPEQDVIPRYLLPPDPSLCTDPKRLRPSAQYCVQRASPLICPNQGLVEALDVIRHSRELEGEARSALSYSRAIAALKAYPRKIVSRRDVVDMPYIGNKISGMVEEWMNTGKLTESDLTKFSERFQSLSLFSSIYGIGTSTARMLWARGLRSLDDLHRWYRVDVMTHKLLEDTPSGADSATAITEEDLDDSFREEGEDGKEGLIKVALGFREDLAIKIPRDEVEEMARVVMEVINDLEQGCVSTIVGGYRRGKPESNDVDVVYTHPIREKAEGLCKRVVQQLIKRGLITYVIHYSSGRYSFGPRESHFDSLEKALSVFVLPYSSPIAQAQIKKYGHRLRRRFDLIFARPDQYWCAVLGWSGSTMFQRDLRLWAKKEKGMKFDSSGMTRRRDTKMYHPKSEQEIFTILDLDWIEPILRNADA